MSLVKRLRRINISMMLKLVSFIFLIPIIYLLIYSILGYNGYINFAQKEKAGAEVLKKIKPLIYDISLAKIDANINTGTINSHFEELISEFEKQRDLLGLSVEGMKSNDKASILPEEVFNDWKSANNNNISLSDYNNIISKLTEFNTYIGDISNLILDPDLDSYYLMDIALLAMPQTAIRMFDNQLYILQNLNSQDVGFSDRINIAVFNSSFKQSDVDRINGSMHTAFEQDEAFYGISNSLKPNLEPKFNEFNQQSERLLNETQKANNVDTEINPQIILENTTNVLNTVSDLWDNTLDELIVLLDIRIKSYEGGRLKTILIALFSVIIAYVVQFFVTKNISSLIRGVISFTTRISKGDVDEALEELSLLEQRYL